MILEDDDLDSDLRPNTRNPGVVHALGTCSGATSRALRWVKALLYGLESSTTTFQHSSGKTSGYLGEYGLQPLRPTMPKSRNGACRYICHFSLLCYTVVSETHTFLPRPYSRCTSPAAIVPLSCAVHLPLLPQAISLPEQASCLLRLTCDDL